MRDVTAVTSARATAACLPEDQWRLVGMSAGRFVSEPPCVCVCLRLELQHSNAARRLQTPRHASSPLRPESSATNTSRSGGTSASRLQSERSAGGQTRSSGAGAALAVFGDGDSGADLGTVGGGGFSAISASWLFPRGHTSVSGCPPGGGRR